MILNIIIRTLVAVFCIGSLASCVNQKLKFDVDLDSFARADMKEKQRYLLLPGEKGADASDLQFLEFATYVEKVLSEKGHTKVQSLDQADIAIFLSFGIGDPQTRQYSYATPTYGQTEVSAATTLGTVSSFGGMGTYSGATTYTPTYGVTGYVPQIGSYTTYTRFLLMAGYDIAAQAKEAKGLQLWKTEVLSTGSSNDLRLVFPYMVAAMRPYLATNTGRKIRITIPEDDPSILKLRKATRPYER